MAETMSDDPNPCEVLRCPDVTRELSDCEEGHCCHAWTKRARLDWQQQEKDAEGALSFDLMQGERTK
jgi:hypothetical protein